MPANPPKALIFDLLTALLDSWSIWTLSIPTTHAHITGLTWRKRYLELTYACGAYKPYEDLVIQAALDVGLDRVAAQNLVGDWDRIRPWDEVPKVLGRLSRQGVRLGVVTNCSDELGRRAVRNLEGVVRNEMGMEAFVFDEVVTAEEVGFYKPRREPYEAVLRKMGVRAEEAVFVAGSAADIPGASAVGMRVVWNNHVGLERKDGVVPWREGARLDDALGDLLG